MDTAEKKKLALILVDIQNDFLETGALPVPEASQILPTVLDLVNDFKDHLIIATMVYLSLYLTPHLIISISIGLAPS